MRDTFESDQPYKQTESKMQVAGKSMSRLSLCDCANAQTSNSV